MRQLVGPAVPMPQVVDHDHGLAGPRAPRARTASALGEPIASERRQHLDLAPRAVHAAALAGCLRHELTAAIARSGSKACAAASA